jgi:hypothetical protein
MRALARETRGGYEGAAMIVLDGGISTGYFGVPGKDGGKVHLVTKGRPICGTRLPADSEYQWCSYSTRMEFVECERCKRSAVKNRLAEAGLVVPEGGAARKKVRRPPGWKVSGSFWVKGSQYGLRYMCPECGKKALGTSFRNDRHHHRPGCPRLAIHEAGDI